MNMWFCVFDSASNTLIIKPRIWINLGIATWRAGPVIQTELRYVNKTDVRLR